MASPPTEHRILVTGGAGFLGSHILRTLQSSEPTWHLFSLDLTTPSPALPSVIYLPGSITSATATSSALSTSLPTAIIHTAGLVPPLSARYTRNLESAVHATNVSGTEILLAAARAVGTCRAFVYTSSVTAVTDFLAHAYPNIDETWLPSPSSSLVYGESKARAEALVLGANEKGDGVSDSAESRKGSAFYTCVLRPSVLFGPGDTTFLPSLHACIGKGETPFIIGDGLNLWDVTDVRNAAWAHVLAMRNLLSNPPHSPHPSDQPNQPDHQHPLQPSAAGDVFFVTNMEPLPFRDICRCVWAQFGHYPPFEVRIPVWAARAVAGVADTVGGWLGLPVTLSAGSVDDAVAVRYCDGRKAERVLGYRPLVGIEEGLRESCAEYEERLQQERLEMLGKG